VTCFADCSIAETAGEKSKSPPLQTKDAKLRELVESELENLRLGVQIAKLRAAENLSQTKLAALTIGGDSAYHALRSEVFLHDLRCGPRRLLSISAITASGECP
jgi:hypothetical protein